MRLHRLRVAAFGPFTDPVEVDFDDLRAHGLFLLYGATGAGKTSLLDAICFALYGDVPGRRAGLVRAGGLRSDLVGPHAEPVVCCEFSMGERRFEVTRSPSWQRPKKRGTGTTTQQASVRVRELVGGRWQPLASRLDEAGLLLADVLGMTKDQFTTVVLLPQGEFARFLHAPADERRDLLQKLFGTGRFADAEQYLAERRREANAACEQARQHGELLRARINERHTDVTDLLVTHGVLERPPAATAATTPATETTPQQPAGDGCDPDTALDHLVRLEPVLRSRREAAEQALVAASATAQQAVDRERWARQLDEACAALARHHERADEIARHQAVLDAAHRAGAVAGHLESLHRAQDERDQAAQDQAQALAGTGELLAAPAGPGPDQLAEASTVRRREIATLDHLLQQEEQAGQWAGQRQRLQAEQEQLHAAVQRTTEQLEARACERRALAVGRADLVALADQVRYLSTARQRAADREDAATQVAGIAPALGTAQDTVRARIDAAQQARQTYLDARQRRIDGVAAELAAGLAAGRPCPVCGSTEHPALDVPTGHLLAPDLPSQRDTPAPTVTAAEDEEATRGRFEAAQERLEAARTEQAQLQTRLSHWQARTGGLSLTHAQAENRELTLALAQATRAADRLRRHDNRIQDLDDAIADLTTRRDTDLDRLRELTASLAAVTARIDQVLGTLEQAKGEDHSVRDRHDRLTREALRLDCARDAVIRLAAAETAVTKARQAATMAAHEAGFDDVRGAAGARRSDEQVATLRAEVSAHAEALQQATVRADEARQHLPAAGVDLTAAASAVRQAQLDVTAAQHHRDTALAQHERAVRSRDSLRELVSEFHAHEAATEPLRQQAAVITEVSTCVEGGRSGYAVRMRLSAFVLAARLSQVAAAASLRLEVMSAGRYQLEHTDAGRGNARAGLGLRVVDAWTGQDRDPATLSGGETFLASLALALGLADVVSAEAGGLDLETLFVDEGFGSLDDTALDQVMTVLDGLRAGGRSVGVVSHVAELRQRIPARIHVKRDQSGSTVHTEHTAIA